MVESREDLERWFKRCFEDPTALDPDTSASEPVKVSGPPKIPQIDGQSKIDGFMTCDDEPPLPPPIDSDGSIVLPDTLQDSDLS